MIGGAMHERPRLIRSKRDDCGHREQADEGHTHKPNSITGRHRHSCHKELVDLTVQMLVDRRKTSGQRNRRILRHGGQRNTQHEDINPDR